MSEPQVWVLIGVFAASIFGMLTWQTMSFNRALRTSIDGVRDVMDVRFGSIEGRLDRLETKVDGLDRDVQSLTRHVFGADPR